MLDSTAEAISTNRRRAQRRRPRAYVRAQCRESSSSDRPNLASLILDLSVSGAHLVVNQALAERQEVVVEMEACGIRQAVKCLAQVRWQLKLDDGKYCTGFEFDKALADGDWLKMVLPN